MSKGSNEAAERGGGSLQTLDRGLRVLELVSARTEGVTIAELTAALGVHRAIAYRLVSTLELRGLLVRGRDGRLRLGAAVMALAARFQPQLVAATDEILRELADNTGSAAFLSVAHGSECVAIAVAEPTNTALRIAYRVGSRHPLTRGAAGIAILAGRPEQPDDTAQLRQARCDGFVVTRGQVQPGATGVASPVAPMHGESSPLIEASIGVVTLGDPDIAFLSAAVTRAAATIYAAIGTG